MSLRETPPQKNWSKMIFYYRTLGVPLMINLIICSQMATFFIAEQSAGAYPFSISSSPPPQPGSLVGLK